MRLVIRDNFFENNFYNFLTRINILGKPISLLCSNSSVEDCPFAAILTDTTSGLCFLLNPLVPRVQNVVYIFKKIQFTNYFQITIIGSRRW